MMTYDLPKADVLVGNCCHETDLLRKYVEERDMKACMPAKMIRKFAISHDRTRHQLRHKVWGKLLPR